MRAEKKPEPAEAPSPVVIEEPLEDNTEKLLGMIEEVLGRNPGEEVVKNLQRRRRFLEWCRNNPRNQERVSKHCAGHIADYVNLFVWQYNPLKLDQEVGPFILWDFQEDALLATPETHGKPGLLWCYLHLVSCVIEKSREMGASWLLLILVDWVCRFSTWKKALAISRDSDAVDTPDDPDCLFWKLDFIQEHLPSWLGGHRRQTKERKRRKISYPRTRSAITGQASTAKAGVGGRASLMLIDEFSRIDEAVEVRRRTASTTTARFFNGTHVGTHTEFFRLTQTPELPKIVMHWSQHPDKNKGLYSYDVDNKKLRFWEYVPGVGLRELRGPVVSYPRDFAFVLDGTPTGGPHPGLRSPWYDAKCREIGSVRAVAEELDIDPRGSASKPFDPLVIHQLKQHCRPPLWQGDVEYSHDGELVRLIEVSGGPLKLWVRPNGNKVPAAPYGAGADVSAGTGNSPSTLAIANGTTGEKVLAYSNAHIRPDDFGVLAVALCRLFQAKDGTGAQLAWEHHGPGVQFGQAVLEEAGYRNVYRSTPDESSLRKRGVVKTTSPGWRPMGKNKNLLLMQYYLALLKREYLNLQEEALEEALEFRYDATGRIVHAKEAGADPEAARENHGDQVVADALSCKMVLEGGRLSTKQAEVERPVKPEDNVFTMAGRRAMTRQGDDGRLWG